jgi:galactoside 2-L-fucosyltransferase 1/2
MFYYNINININMPSLSDYTVFELKKKAKSKGLHGYSRLHKAELVKLLGGKPKYRKRSSRSVSKTQIAFCFLLYDKIQHTGIWEDFLNQDHDGTSTVYSHVKKVTSETSDWIKKARVRTVATSWCGEGIINGFNQMLKKALKNTDNKYFILISGTDIPLYTYPETYKKILSTGKARIHYMRELDNVFEDSDDIYNHHVWVILNREVAKQYIRLSDRKDKKAYDFVKRFRKLYEEHGNPMKRGVIENPTHDYGWLGSCPDEVYPINWLVELYGQYTSVKFKKNIKYSMPTYSAWDFKKDPDHPKIFNIRTVKRAKKEICGNGHIFARKFTSDAAKWIAMQCGKGTKESRSSDKVIVRKELVGRLGNQMFQYASSLGIATRKHGKPCIILDDDLISYDELRKEKDDLINVCKGPFEICGHPDYDFTVIPEVGHARYDTQQYMIPGSIEIETDMDQGFLQSYKYFENVQDIVRKKFQFKGDTKRKVNRFMKKIKTDSTKIVGIHVRRGDQIGLQILRFPPINYFKRAKEYFRKKYDKVRFIIATNDRSWAKKNLSSNDTEVITHSKSAVEDMAILAACDGVIMSIGTFSFWGAWLCGGPVIYYENEFVMNHSVNKGKVIKSDYYPSTWIPMK